MLSMDFEDRYDGEDRKKKKRKNKRFDDHEDNAGSREKRSGKRFHRKRTQKDDFDSWSEEPGE